MLKDKLQKNQIILISILIDFNNTKYKFFESTKNSFYKNYKIFIFLYINAKEGT